MKNNLLLRFLELEEDLLKLCRAGNVVDEALIKKADSVRESIGLFIQEYESMGKRLEEKDLQYRLLVRENNILLSGFKTMLEEMER